MVKKRYYKLIIILISSMFITSCVTIKKRYSIGYSVYGKKSLFSNDRNDFSSKSNPYHIATTIPNLDSRNERNINLFISEEEILSQQQKIVISDTLVRKNKCSLGQFSSQNCFVNVNQFSIINEIKRSHNKYEKRTLTNDAQIEKVKRPDIDPSRLKKNAKILLWTGFGLYIFGLVFLVLETNEVLMALLIGSGSVLMIIAAIMALISFFNKLSRK